MWCVYLPLCSELRQMRLEAWKIRRVI
jgi:hypothetical protein